MSPKDWSPTDLAALSVETATVVPQASAWSRVRASWSVRAGGLVLIVLVCVAFAVAVAVAVFVGARFWVAVGVGVRV